mmetsp:Transcript_27807/g.54741  ORF Transcript_27807/g.54741 Transcript_27807/m.54741 type:complete len:436 (-) Transcript_27807:67-1374(-)
MNFFLVFSLVTALPLATAAWAPDCDSQGVISLTVFRSAKKSSPYTPSLESVNAGNDAGALSYLHTEVIPEDMHSRGARKFGIDVIVKFAVKVKNPSSFGWCKFGAFQAYDGGKCTVPNCDADHAKRGFWVGHQSQNGNPRHKYTTGYWYSFPKEGLCDYPTGAFTCTYSYHLLGYVVLDQLAKTLPDYRTFDNNGGTEFSRQSRTSPGCCVTVKSVEYWKDPCDESLCNTRVSVLSSFPVVNWGPTQQPSPAPPTNLPTLSPTTAPPTTASPTAPTEAPTGVPSASPTDSPTANPTNSPSQAPSWSPTSTPTDGPTTVHPTTLSPTPLPTPPTTLSPTPPTTSPTHSPSQAPTPPTAAAAGMTDSEVEGVVFGSLGAVCLVMGTIFVWRRRKRKHTMMKHEAGMIGQDSSYEPPAYEPPDETLFTKKSLRGSLNA